MEWRSALADGGTRPQSDRQTPVRAAISRWRAGLIDATAANPLLSFQPESAPAIEVARPFPEDVLARLAAGGSFAFRSLQPWAGAAAGTPPPAPYILDSGSHPDELETALRLLMRRSGSEWLERGLPVLYMAFGMLHWTSRDGARYTSPLLLVPVKLVAAERQPPMLEPTPDDPVVNPALTLELSRYRISLPSAEDLESLTLSRVLDEVRTAIAGRGWLVSERAALSCFSASNEATYADLLGHEDTAAAHPVVRALATGELGAAPATGETGTRGGAEDVPLILAADSSQQACVRAALSGRSFTVDGPPGTGKSQTIANMIGALLHAGKTVLMVSQKAAALDVVAGRLTGAGLGGYLLELHSHKASRKEVAASLAKALDTAPVPPPGRRGDPAARTGTDLGAYGRALNRIRGPLARSLHDVLAVITRMRDVPVVPALGIDAAQLTAGTLGEVHRAAVALAAAWRPAAQGPSFVWREVTEQGSLDDRLYQAASALESLAKLARGNQPLATATGLTRPSQAHELAQLLDHLTTWPERLPDDWLTQETLDVVDVAAAQLTVTLAAIAAREDQVVSAAGIPWRAIPRQDELPSGEVTSLAALTPPCADVSGLGAGQITDVAQEFAAMADLLERWRGKLAGLAATLGVRTPATFSGANDLLTLARLAAERDQPERAWLSVAGHRAASRAAQALYDAHRALAAAEAAASAYFTAGALRQDVTGLIARLTNEYHGLGRLSAAYRADKRTVRTFTRAEVPEDTAEAQLPLAAAWQRAAQSLAAAEAGHAALLGPYYAGRATDFTRLARALAHAATAVRCARGQDLSRAADHVSRGAVPDPAISASVAQARKDLSIWQAALAPEPAIAPRPELLHGTVDDAIGWLRAHAGPLAAASQFTSALAEATGTPLTFGQARQLVALREAAASAHAELAAREAVLRDLCAGLYAGTGTDVTAVRDALAWAHRLRALITGGPGPLTPAQLKAAESAIPADRLAKAASDWQQASAALLSAFSPARAGQLAAELDDYQAGYELLEAMFGDVSGRGEWHAYQAARGCLARHGLDGAIGFCITERVEADRVPQVLDRALLHEWAEHQLRTDPDLAPLREAGRDNLADRYRELNGALAAAAAGEVIRACNARRPHGDTAEAAVIAAESAKQTGHLPVRRLLRQTRRLTQAVKPCFLMPPQAVSQLLPADMHFDVVIFDEASQIGPADAISAIYRGSAVIIAGDHRQLPPARPGSHLDSGGGPRAAGAQSTPWAESVLDLARASGRFGSLALSWHYRSQDEALIAFSNAAFYDGRLVPVPGGGGPEAGVALFCGQGTCRREAPGANPGEAARVVQRVVHHFSSRPDLSLGVVTFSEAQATAIEAALSKARQQRPDLDRCFTAGRLRGFFVKSADAAQGDERDVLIVSVGYGPGEDGQLTSDFGPLSRDGGWRSLNVAITRARYRTEIVTSIQPSDVPESAGEGLRQLRRYLSYAGEKARNGGLNAVW